VIDDRSDCDCFVGGDPLVAVVDDDVVDDVVVDDVDVVVIDVVIVAVAVDVVEMAMRTILNSFWRPTKY